MSPPGDQMAQRISLIYSVCIGIAPENPVPHVAWLTRNVGRGCHRFFSWMGICELLIVPFSTAGLRQGWSGGSEGGNPKSEIRSKTKILLVWKLDGQPIVI